jgi:hypothetical protein
MVLSIGVIFGFISGLLTTLGLILSNTSAKFTINQIILVLISLAISDGLSDALGIYYGTYNRTKDIKEAMKEGGKTLLFKASIPCIIALLFFMIQNIKYANYITLFITFLLIIGINIFIFSDLQLRILNMIIFFIIVFSNYYIGKRFSI